MLRQWMPVEIDAKSPPFDRYKGLQPLAGARNGDRSSEYARHQLYVARDPQTSARVLIKLASRPGLIYQRDLVNEIASLTTIKHGLPHSRYFPYVHDHGQLRDGRVYLTISLFDEFPLATTIGEDPAPERTVSHLRVAIEIARALKELHGLGIYHVDLNPMNVLHRTEKDKPVIRLVDFESSYEVARHGAGESYNPPTTPGYSAPEVCDVAPDARADVFSLGAVLYTMVAGYQWTWKTDVNAALENDDEFDAELKKVLQRAVQPQRERRHPTIDALYTDLGGYLEKIWPGRSW
jgi:eukaryotic-like serine/threonine-protein kinase